MGKKTLVTRKRIVAIVDDEKDITVLFSDALQRIEGISTITFTDPKIALEHFKTYNEEYALVLSDFRMAGLNGIELIKKIKESNPLVRTLLMTAFEIESNLIEEYTKKQIINKFLQKPIHLDDLFAEVKDQLYIYELQKK